jgi:hypothetical protein
MTIPGLPAGYSVRRPTLADGEAILAVVHAAKRDALGRDGSTLAEVDQLLRLPRTPPETDHWLVESNGQAAAWGMVIDDTAAKTSISTSIQIPSIPNRSGKHCSTSCSNAFASTPVEHWGYEPMDLSAFRESVTAEDDPEFGRWRFAVVDGGRAGICHASGRFAVDEGGWIRSTATIRAASMRP